jgi:hypothetical protein
MIQAEIDAAYREVMEKGDLILRMQLKRFEEKVAAFVGTKYAVGLNSGYHPPDQSHHPGPPQWSARRHGKNHGPGAEA